MSEKKRPTLKPIVPKLDTPCIEWSGPLRNNGYGLRYFRGKYMSAHRAEWIERKGEIPKGLYVLHKCDNRKCFNLEHLYLGTHSQNMQDSRNRGRAWAQKLYPDDVRAIRRAVAAGESRHTVAAKYGVKKKHLDKVISGVFWFNLPNE